MPPCFLNGTDSTSWNILSFDDASDALPLGVRDSLAGLFSASPKIVVLTKGMSVIGPRPMILAEYEQIQARDRYGANDIRPGLIGWAQVNGRDGVTVEQRARLDG